MSLDERYGRDGERRPKMSRQKALPVTLLLGSTLLVLGIASGSSPDHRMQSGSDPAGTAPGVRIEAFGMTVSGPRPGNGDMDAVTARIDDAGPDCRDCPDGRNPTSSGDRAEDDSRDNMFARIGITVVRAAAKVCVCVLERLLKFALDRFPFDGILKGLD
jgi:hypothetical protein